MLCLQSRKLEPDGTASGAVFFTDSAALRSDRISCRNPALQSDMKVDGLQAEETPAAGKYSLLQDLFNAALSEEVALTTVICFLTVHL